MYTVETNGEIITFMHMVKSAGTSIHVGIIEASTDYSKLKVHVNQRHAHIRNLPEKYQKYKKITVIRNPEDWYRSFYRFFINVEGYLSFMLNDPKDPYDGYIYPIEPDEFIRRSMNLKETLMRFPNKARVFRNLLRSQGNMHFVTGYFESDFHPSEPETMEQFGCTLYDWFLRPMGKDTIFIPMNRLDIIEDMLDIKIPHINVTPKNKIECNFSDESIRLIMKHHRDIYNMYENFDESNMMTFSEYCKKQG